MAKIVIIIVVGFGLLIGGAALWDKMSGPPLPRAERIEPPEGVERLPRAFSPAAVLSEHGLSIGTALGSGAPALGGGALAAQADPDLAQGEWLMGQWIHQSGWNGEIKGIKRRGDVTRISIDVSLSQMPGWIYVIAEIPGDPGHMTEGSSWARLDGRIAQVTLSDDVMTKGHEIVLVEASVLEAR
ncbi:MAG: hypothetical protein AAGI53_15645 [Planctomycetota bacterium]